MTNENARDYEIIIVGAGPAGLAAGLYAARARRRTVMFERKVIGGGDAAMDEGIFLTRFVEKAIVVHRRDKLRASAILQERAFANPKMEFVWNTVVEEILGDDHVTGLRVRDVVTGETHALDVA